MGNRDLIEQVRKLIQDADRKRTRAKQLTDFMEILRSGTGSTRLGKREPKFTIRNAESYRAERFYTLSYNDVLELREFLKGRRDALISEAESLEQRALIPEGEEDE